MFGQTLSELIIGRRHALAVTKIPWPCRPGFRSPAGLRSTAKFQAYFPHSERHAHHWYAAAQKAWPDVVEDLTARIAQREDFAKLEYLCGKLALNSTNACLFVLHLLDQGAEPALVAPIRLGYLPHPLVDPASLRRVEYRPLPCLILDHVFLP